MVRLANVLATASVIVLASGCFDFTVDAAPSSLGCASGTDCPDDLLCLTSLGRCVPAGDPCVTSVGRDATAAVDGAACAVGLICVEAACVSPRCGDGVVTTPETCDGSPACRATCTSCGDGVLDDGEACDTGAQNSDVEPGACRTTCVAAVCGDGTIDPGEGCDDGVANSDVAPDACRTDCAPASCGDGTVDDGEGCDDGAANSLDPDRCRPTCAVPGCGDGVRDDGEGCDNGDQNSDVEPAACRTRCVAPSCGDSVRDPEEGCDDGPANSDDAPDACRTDCARPTCGDGVVDSGEVCDDDNTVSGDGCRADCRKVEVCGDGVIDTGEQCDDANDNRLDGCALCLSQGWGVDLVVSGALDSRDALGASFAPEDLATDFIGRVYVVDAQNFQVHRLNLDGTVTTLAGTGVAGFSGDGGPSTGAALNLRAGIAVDAVGRVYIADTDNHRLRRIDVDGTITTIAGTGVGAFSGDGGPATAASLFLPQGVALDANGRIYISDSVNSRVRRINADGTITTVAGGGAGGDGGPATSAVLSSPRGIAVDGAGRLYITEVFNNRVRRVDEGGIITTFAGTGTAGVGGNGGLATGATLIAPSRVAVDASGRVIISGGNNFTPVRRVDTDGIISIIAGNLVAGFSGDGGPAGSASFKAPGGVAVDAIGRVLIADTGNRRIRRLDTDGVITTVAGTGLPGIAGAGGPATSAPLSDPTGVTHDREGRVVFADTRNNRIRRIEPDGTLVTLAGTGGAAFAGDGGPATSAAVNFPRDVAVDAEGRVVFVDTGNSRVRRIGLDGVITTIAGTGASGFSGDGGLATAAVLSFVRSLAIDAAGRIVLVDAQRIRRIDTTGTISTIAGTGSTGFSGDGGQATLATFNTPSAVTIDAAGAILVTDQQNNRVRRIDDNGVITTIVGGASGFSGDTGLATNARMQLPSDVSFDNVGRLLVVDSGNRRIRRVDDNGIITTVVGSGATTFNLVGDGGSARNAVLQTPTGVAVDAAGRMAITDLSAARVRRVDADGIITTIAGAIHPAGPGPADRARLYASTALLSFDPDTLLSVGAFGRILDVTLSPGTVTVVAGYANAAPEAFSQGPFAPLLEDARGVAFDPVAMTLVVTEHDAGALRLLNVDPDEDGVIDDATTWTIATLEVDVAGPAGVIYDIATDTFIVVDQADHCVVRLDRDGTVLETVFGRCGLQGSFVGFLNEPSHVAISPTSGALYIADTGNHRIVRVDGGDQAIVLGDGSFSSAGEGRPARRFPVQGPRQLAIDAFGNLYVASTTTVRLVANIDGDLDADGDDQVSTIFGGGSRDTFPESDTLCLGALTRGDDDTVYAADACQGFMVRLTPTVTP